jgi:flagellar basal body-associated protein FliL
MSEAPELKRQAMVIVSLMALGVIVMLGGLFWVAGKFIYN